MCQTEQGFNDAAAAAEQFQPKGTTLSTTEVLYMYNVKFVTLSCVWSVLFLTLHELTYMQLCIHVCVVHILYIV